MALTQAQLNSIAATVASITKQVDALKPQVAAVAASKNTSSSSSSKVDVAATNAAREKAAAAGQNPNTIKIYSGSTPTKPPATPTKTVAEINAAREANIAAGKDPYSGAGAKGQLAGVASSINDSQDIVAEALASVDAPATRTSSSDFSAKLSEALAKISATKAPKAPDFEAEYGKLTTKYGTADIEAQISQLDTDEANLRAQWDAMKTNEKGKPVAMNVINGRLSEEQQTVQDQLDSISLKKNALNNQLTTKYNTINNIMSLKKLDYATATDTYDKEYSKQIQMINLVKGIADDAKTEIEAAEDDARANANIIYNAISSGAADTSKWSTAQITQMTKLETQAGLPVGFYKTLAVKNPKADIISTTTRTTSGGEKYADVLVQGTDGKPTVQSIYLGEERVPDSGNKTETDTDPDNKLITEIQDYADDLIARMVKKEINWATAFSRMRERYPNLSVNAIDNTLGLQYRAKYDKPLK